MEVNELKTAVSREVEANKDRLNELSLKIHANPELGFHEVKAAEWLTAFLEENSFSVERGICELPTAFRASYGQGKPVIGLVAEYDALPGLGHACGHNLICMMAVGAAIASKLVVDRGKKGTISVVGAPAEEIWGGKAIMADRGGFDHLDTAMMVHPGTANAVTTHGLAAWPLNVEFFGKSAHAAAKPEEGINALEAMLLSFTAINSLRQHIRSTARVHGVITDGGQAVNAVPAHAAGSFLVRAEDMKYLEELKQRVLNCFIGAATATGARLEFKWGEGYYAPFLNNMTMARLFQRNMQSLGRTVRLARPGKSYGSTDMGNVSQIVPGIHPSVAIAPKKVLGHSPEMAVAAASEAGLKGLIDGAKALAMTAVDLFTSEETLSQVKAEFQAAKKREK
ncbi:MAG: M20 family metallopeptidase [Dehalococcoidales bacterium]|nr:M20 family metallopeptidase [Dehalococcoidales bacterium]